MECTIASPLRRISGSDLKRLHLISDLNDKNWLELLELNWFRYTMVASDQEALPEKSYYSLAHFFNCSPDLLYSGKVNFCELQIQKDQGKWRLPEEYARANYGRKRTTITSFEFLENKFGWKLRFDLLKKLGISEEYLLDPFSHVSMKFITDTCDILSKHHFSSDDFFEMGSYSYTGNSQSTLAQIFSDLESPKEVIERMWGDLLPFYENNCDYNFLSLSDAGAVIEVKSKRHVADEMGVVNLGSKHICSLKAGMMASSPLYVGRVSAEVKETKCVHCGDASCVYEIVFH